MNKAEVRQLINEVQDIGAARGWDMLDKLEYLVSRATIIEREACAVVCQTFDDGGGAGEAWANRFAEVVRARSDKEK